MTTTQRTGPVSRRAVLEGLGVGALGLAGAALLGCGGGNSTGTGQVAADESGKVVGATSGGGLPLNAPKIEGTIREGGRFRGGSAADGVQFDGHTALAGNIHHTIGEKSLEPDPPTMKIKPHVVTQWEVADPSGTTLILKLHPKLFIHNKPPWNGRQFTAEDLAWNLERHRGLYAERLKIPKASFQRASMVEYLTKAEAVDPLTVKVTLSKPNSSFFNGLMEIRVMLMPREMDDIGYSDPMKMGNIGPYEVTSWETDVKSTFKKNPRYTEFQPGQPHFDELFNNVIPDQVAQQASFLQKESGYLAVTNPEILQSARRGAPDANLYTWVDANWFHLRPSIEFAPFKDYRVRQAQHLAFDYKANGDAVYGPEGGWAWMAALHPAFPEAWSPDKVKGIAGYNPDTRAADIAEAHKLMTAAGFPNGKGLEYEIIHGGSTNDHALRFQNYMNQTFKEGKVGIKPLGGGATFANRQAEGNFQMLAYTITATCDAVVEMISQYKTGGSRNYGHFSNAESDAILEKTVGELNFDARKQLLDQYQQKWISEWRPMYVMHANATKYMFHSNIGGFHEIAGTWSSYWTQNKMRLLYYVDK
jgi:dipeptide transport system substrate-binding protein